MQTFNHTRPDSTPPSSISYKNKQAQQGKDRAKSIRFFLLAFLTSIIMIWASSLWLEQNDVIAQKQQELDRMKEKVREANEQQVELSYQIKRLQDPDYIAEIARRDYFLSKPGETIFKTPSNK